jgi:hypothetical protein
VKLYSPESWNLCSSVTENVRFGTPVAAQFRDSSNTETVDSLSDFGTDSCLHFVTSCDDVCCDITPESRNSEVREDGHCYVTVS